MRNAFVETRDCIEVKRLVRPNRIAPVYCQNVLYLTMPAANIYHSAVRAALTADGWTITHDPLTLAFGGRDLFVDLAAERAALAAEKSGRKIAVEVHSFILPSPVRDLQDAIGQYEIYRALLTELDAERTIYLAVPRRTYEGLLGEQFGRFVIARLQIKLLVVDMEREKVVTWIE
jgi:hypothetical protein